MSDLPDHFLRKWYWGRLGFLKMGGWDGIEGKSHLTWYIPLNAGRTFPFWLTLFRNHFSRTNDPVRNFGKVLWNSSNWNRDPLLWRGAGFSHWYHMALQLWTPGLICVGLCNCVQWTWNRAKNKKANLQGFSSLVKSGIATSESFSRGLCYKVIKWRKNLSLSLGRGSSPPGDDGIKHKVTFLVITLVGRWGVKFCGGGEWLPWGGIEKHKQ